MGVQTLMGKTVMVSQEARWEARKGTEPLALWKKNLLESILASSTKQAEVGRHVSERPKPLELRLTTLRIASSGRQMRETWLNLRVTNQSS